MPQKQIKVNVDKERIKAYYSDIVFVSQNPFGFSFDFGQQIPQMRFVEIVSRVSMSPAHAKAFANLLNKNLALYEKSHGKIRVSQAMKKEIARRKAIGFQAN